MSISYYYPAPSTPDVTTADPGPLVVQVRLYLRSALVWMTSENWTTTMLVMVSPNYVREEGKKV